MIRLPYFVLTAILCLGLGAPGVRAAPYVLDKSHAHVTLAVSHLGFSMVRGQFREFEATIDFVDEDVPWCHIDIAGMHAAETDEGMCVKGTASGFGARLLAELVG